MNEYTFTAYGKKYNTYSGGWYINHDYDNLDAEQLLSLPNLLVGVYGTLRKGERAEGMMSSMSHIADVRMPMFVMFNVGSFPFLARRTSNSVADVLRASAFRINAPLVELYESPDADTLDTLDGYEGYPLLYHRSVVCMECVDNETGNCVNFHVAVYTWASDDVDRYDVIASGDWVNRNEKPQPVKLRSAVRDRIFLRDLPIEGDGP